MKKSLALLATLSALTAGCGADTKRATNVTSSSATLNAEVECAPGTHGTAWWELREAGAPGWRLADGRGTFSCPGAGMRSVRISKPVAGLQAGVRYEYRLGADPAPDGGRVLHSSATSFTTDRFRPGLVASADHPLSAAAARALGADVVRLEFDVGTPASSIRKSIDVLAHHGARALLLAGFHGRIPTKAEAENLAGWAAEFGWGGSFWHGRADGHLAVHQIEFGNETSYAHQYGDNYAAQSYRDRAKAYATRFAQARAAIGLTGRDVGLLAQADDGGSGSSNWVDGMFDAVPNLGQLVGGWVVHPYGPRATWEPKLDRLIAQTAANGAPATIPIDVTEYGLSSANGAPLSDNYGWPVDQTYAEAAAALEGTVAAMRGDPAIGPRLRHFMIYAAHDLRGSGATRDREHYFGVLTHDLAGKGAYSSEVRELLR
jgi:hypothetical protein